MKICLLTSLIVMFITLNVVAAGPDDAVVQVEGHAPISQRDPPLDEGWGRSKRWARVW